MSKTKTATPKSAAQAARRDADRARRMAAGSPALTYLYTVAGSHWVSAKIARSGREWNAVRSDPEAWADAVEVDRAVRGSLDGLDTTECFLHYSGTPLERAIGETPEQAGQVGMFGGLGNECEGVCGV